MIFKALRLLINPRTAKMRKSKPVQTKNRINKKNKAALNSIKMQAASEVGVPLKDNGYNGDLTSKQAGSIGGQMVKKMIESYEMSNKQ